MLWGAALVLGLMGCLPALSSVSERPMPRLVPSLVWPDPPDPPRIRYGGSFSRPEELPSPEKSWWKKAWEWVFGQEVIGLTRPYGVATDPEGRIYVVDTGSVRLHVFDPPRNRYRAITHGRSDPLKWPVAVALDEQGQVYLTDAELRRILVYNREGKPIAEMGKESDLKRPTGIAYSQKAGLLYVADTHGHQVVAFDRSGKEAFRFGRRGEKAGELNFPVHLWVDRNGEVYVCDTMNFRIQVFDPQGKFLTGFGQLGDGTGDFSKPKGVAVDSEGHIYVVEGIFDVVQVFDREGHLLLIFGRRGSNPGELWMPAGIFIDSQDRIYVADQYNQRVQMFQYLKPADSTAPAGNGGPRE